MANWITDTEIEALAQLKRQVIASGEHLKGGTMLGRYQSMVHALARKYGASEGTVTGDNRLFTPANRSGYAS